MAPKLWPGRCPKACAAEGKEVPQALFSIQCRGVGVSEDRLSKHTHLQVLRPCSVARHRALHLDPERRGEEFQNPKLPCKLEELLRSRIAKHVGRCSAL